MKNLKGDFTSKTTSTSVMTELEDAVRDINASKNKSKKNRYHVMDELVSRFLVIIYSIATVTMAGGSVFCVLNVHKFSGWAAVGTFACAIVCFAVSCIFWKSMPKDIRKIFSTFAVKSYDEYKEDN